MKLTDYERASYFRSAADFLRPRRRWIRHALYRLNEQTVTGACAVGALRLAADTRVGYNPTYNDLLKRLQFFVPNDDFPFGKTAARAEARIMRYNDEMARKKDVVALFDAAADAHELRAQITGLNSTAKAIEVAPLIRERVKA